MTPRWAAGRPLPGLHGRMMRQPAMQKRVSTTCKNVLDSRKFAGDRRSYPANSLINRPILAP